MIAVVVLGVKINSKKISNELKGRTDTGIIKFYESNADFLILSGGRTNLNYSAECEIMCRYAMVKGVPREKIILDPNSLDTIGNAFFTHKIIEKIESMTEIIVVSSCYHMERIQFIFSMCYGPKYNLDFTFCYNYPGKEEHEKHSLNLAMNFFRNIEPGDCQMIEKRLYSEHKLYSKL